MKVTQCMASNPMKECCSLKGVALPAIVYWNTIIKQILATMPGTYPLTTPAPSPDRDLAAATIGVQLKEEPSESISGSTRGSEVADTPTSTPAPKVRKCKTCLVPKPHHDFAIGRRKPAVNCLECRNKMRNGNRKSGTAGSFLPISNILRSATWIVAIIVAVIVLAWGLMVLAGWLCTGSSKSDARDHRRPTECSGCDGGSIDDYWLNAE